MNVSAGAHSLALGLAVRYLCDGPSSDRVPRLSSIPSALNLTKSGDLVFAEGGREGITDGKDGTIATSPEA